MALRALMHSVLILTQLGLYSEAAQQLIQFNALPELMDLSDLVGAVLLEHSARIFSKAGNRRRKIALYLVWPLFVFVYLFHQVTAGTHVLKFASKKQISADILQRSKLENLNIKQNLNIRQNQIKFRFKTKFKIQHYHKNKNK